MITFIRCDTDTTTNSIVDVDFLGRKTTLISKKATAKFGRCVTFSTEINFYFFK